jgi:branched-chain amino acid transport system permease protein
VHGLSFLAVREDEIASSAMGVNVTRTKVTAFLLGSAFAGAAGALLAHDVGFISPAMFTMDTSFILLTMVVLGGTGSITGSVVAALLLFYIPEKMRDLGNVQMSSLVAIAIALVIAVVLIKRFIDRYRGPRLRKTFVILGIITGGIILEIILATVLKNAHGLEAQVEGSKLRLVVFAVTLVILMLLRPQGIFAHHEFSWTWVKKLLGRHWVAREATR